MYFWRNRAILTFQSIYRSSTKNESGTEWWNSYLHLWTGPCRVLPARSRNSRPPQTGGRAGPGSSPRFWRAPPWWQPHFNFRIREQSTFDRNTRRRIKRFICILYNANVKLKDKYPAVGVLTKKIGVKDADSRQIGLGWRGLDDTAWAEQRYVFHLLFYVGVLVLELFASVKLKNSYVDSRNITRTSINIMMSNKSVKFQFWVHRCFKKRFKRGCWVSLPEISRKGVPPLCSTHCKDLIQEGVWPYRPFSLNNINRS